MAASNGGAGGGPISAEARAALGEALGLMFGRWTALQMAVENQWGGRESRAKADQLGESTLSWFCDSKEDSNDCQIFIGSGKRRFVAPCHNAFRRWEHGHTGWNYEL